MLEFNLKDAMEGWPMVSRNGLKTFKFGTFFEEANEECQLVVIDHRGTVHTRFANGLYYKDMVDEDDLMMVEPLPSEKEVWLVVESANVGPISFLNKEAANSFAKKYGYSEPQKITIKVPAQVRKKIKETRKSQLSKRHS